MATSLGISVLLILRSLLVRGLLDWIQDSRWGLYTYHTQVDGVLISQSHLIVKLNKTNLSCLVLLLLVFLLNLNTPHIIPTTNTTVTAPNIAPPMNTPTVTAVVSPDGDGRVLFKYSNKIYGGMLKLTAQYMMLNGSQEIKGQIGNVCTNNLD